MKPETALLRLIAKVPAGEKLPVAAMARMIGATQSVVMAMVERMIADGKLDRETLRPISEQAPEPQVLGGGMAEARPLNGAELFGRLVDAGKARGLSVAQVSRAIFNHPCNLYRLRFAESVRPATLAKIRGFLNAGGGAPASQPARGGVPAAAATPRPAADCGGAERACARPAAPPPFVSGPASQPLAGVAGPASQPLPGVAGPASQPLPGVARRASQPAPGERVRTGAELAAAIADAALIAGVGIARFCAPLSRNPQNYVDQLRLAKRPTSATVARVEAFLAREAVLPPRQRQPVAERDPGDQLLEAEVARATRHPGESLAEAVKREAAVREARFREATRLTTAHPLPVKRQDDPDIGLVTADRRERELEQIPTPSSLIRRAQRDWPDQCAKVKALAAELGCSLADTWHKVISAGVECMTDPEAT